MRSIVNSGWADVLDVTKKVCDWLILRLKPGILQHPDARLNAVLFFGGIGELTEKAGTI